MSKRIEAVKLMRKSNKLVRLFFRENGPRSFKRGVGALLSAVYEQDGPASRDDLVVALGATRVALKDIVRKAKREGFVVINFVDDESGYTVELTDAGKELVKKRCEAMDATAEQALAVLSDEEVEQFIALNEKIALALHEQGISAKKKGFLQKRHKKHSKSKCYSKNR